MGNILISEQWGLIDTPTWLNPVKDSMMISIHLLADVETGGIS